MEPQYSIAGIAICTVFWSRELYGGIHTPLALVCMACLSAWQIRLGIQQELNCVSTLESWLGDIFTVLASIM